jgi:hypothetical protein
MRVFMAVGVAVSKGGTPYGQYVLQNMFAATPQLNLYGTVQGIGYPPLWGLMIGGMHVLSSVFAPNNLYAYVLALKLPVIVGELALAVLVYNILKVQTNEKIATATYLLFIFCPFIMVVGTVWGMFDVIALVFALLSAYVLQRDWKLSAVFLSVSSLLKLFPLVLAPLYSIFLYKFTRSLKLAVSFLASTVAITAVFSFLPMILFNWPISNMYNALTYQFTTANPSYDNAASFPYGAASPFNAFTLLNNLAHSSIQPLALSVYIWIPACVAVYILLLRARTSVTVKEVGASTDFTLIVQWSLLLFLTLFTTRAWVSEQNLIFLFVFFSLSMVLQYRKELYKVQLLWLLLFIFVLVHVPAISFLWLPLPWTLNAGSAFANGSLGWTRLLLMTGLTLSWLALCWHYVARKLRWW